MKKTISSSVPTADDQVELTTGLFSYDAFRAENECKQLFQHPTLTAKEKKIRELFTKQERQNPPRKHKYPSLNSSDLTAARDDELDIVEDVQSEIGKHEEEPDEVQQQPMAAVLAAIEKLEMATDELVKGEKLSQEQEDVQEEDPVSIEGEEEKDEQGDMFTDEVDEWSIILDEDDDASSQWTFTSGRPDTADPFTLTSFLQAVIASTTSSVSEPATTTKPITNNTSTPKSKGTNHSKKTSGGVDGIDPTSSFDFEGEYLAYKQPGSKQVSGGRRKHRKGRG
jgi:hypothetical protein